MPRKAITKAPADPKKNIDIVALEKDAAALDEHHLRLTEIDARFGDGLPYDRGRLIHEIRFFLQQSATAMLEAGRQMIVLKEHEPHGEWLELLNDIGIAPRTAQAMMKAAAKYSGKKTALANLGKSKLLELMVEDDEELEGLADGGTLAGMTLDDVDRMSVKELRANLRKAKEKQTQDEEVHEKLLTQKDQKINELDKKLHGNVLPTWPELVAESEIQTVTAAFRAQEALDQLDVLREQILNGDLGDMAAEDADPMIEAMAVTYHDTLSQVWARAGELMAAADETLGGYKQVAEARAANAPEQS
ncbi:MAG: DUF3102 domain-containing protein [Candidatus Sedimenticola sp. (ex Thyasira tokunagai)]